jgi:hypothetical protein
MGFLAPWLLAGTAAIALPVWLHLLQRHRSTPLPFASLMFFERHVQSSVKYRRLRYLLLFALRAALIALLALAFANPFLTRHGAAAAGAGKLVILAVDNSFSMRQGGRLERAKREAAAETARVRPQDKLQIISFAQKVTEESGIPAIPATEARSSYGELARALRSMSAGAKMPAEVHLFSDMQRTSMPPDFADLRLAGGVKLILHPVVSEPVPNFAVESVKAPARVFEAGKQGGKARIEAVVAGYGTQPARRRVAVLLNGREQAAKTVEVPANGRAAVEFPPVEAAYGPNRGEVRIDSGDAFPEDDRYYFPLERSEPPRVLFAHSARESKAALYVNAALEASPAMPLKLDAVSFEQAAGMAPARYALVALSDPGFLPPGLEDTLTRYVREGGALWIAAGPTTASARRIPVLGTPLAGSRYAARDTERFQMAGALDSSHPAMARLARFDNVRFYQTVRLEADKGAAIARLADGSPLLMEQRLGAGRVLVFASTLDNVSNDFPLHASFVPFIQQTAAYLAGANRQSGTYTVDTDLELGTAEGGAAVEVLDPRGQRALSLAEAAKAKTIALASAGFYEVRRPGAGNQLVGVNPDRRESDLDVIPADALAMWRQSGGGATAAQAGAAGAGTRRVPLGWYVLCAVLIVGLAESLVANRHLGIEGAAGAARGGKP